MDTCNNNECEHCEKREGCPVRLIVEKLDEDAILKNPRERIGYLLPDEVKAYNDLRACSKEIAALELKHRALRDAFWSLVKINHKVFDRALSIDAVTTELFAEK